MANINSYAKVLSDMVKDQAKSTAGSFATGAKMAAFNEMPGIVGAYAAIKDIRNRASKLEQEVAGEKSPLVKESKKNNIISNDMLSQLKQMNNRMAQQNSMLREAQQISKRAAMFQEENAREARQAQRELAKRLSGFGGGSGGPANDAKFGPGGIAGSLIDMVLPYLDDALMAAGVGYGAKKALGGMLGRGGRPIATGAGRYRDPKTGRFTSRPGGGGTRPPGGGGGSFMRGLKAFGGGALRGAARMKGPLPLMLAGTLGFGLYELFQMMRPGGGAAGFMDTRDQKDADIDMKNFMKMLQNAKKSPLQESLINARLKGDRAGVARIQNQLRAQRLQKRNQMAPGFQNFQLGGGISGGRQYGGPAGQTDPGYVPPGGGNGGPVPSPIKPPTGQAGLRWRIPVTRKFWVSSEYDEDRKTYKHKGIDIAVPMGSNVVAAASGKVVRVNLDRNSSAGIFIRLQHADGYTSAYMHLSSVAVSEGQEVQIGQTIGTSGNSGKPTKRGVRSYGIHLHFQVERNGTPVDPRSVINFGPVTKRGEKGPTVDPKVLENGAASKGDYSPNSTGKVAANPTIPSYTPSKAYDTTKGAINAVAGVTAQSNAGGLVPTAAVGVGENIKPITAVTAKSAGGGTQRAAGAVPVRDTTLAEIAEKQLKVSQKGSVAQEKVARNTQGFYRFSRGTKKVITPEDQFDKAIEDFQKGFLKAFDDTTKKVIKDALGEALLGKDYRPGGKGASAQQASNPMFRGRILTDMLDTNKKVASLSTKIFGDTYGKAFTPVFQKMATATLEYGSTKLGEMLFGGNTALGKEGARTLTGQILDNYKRGNKKVAIEQALFGMTGIATGPETIAAKYGFKDADAGVDFMADVMAGKATNFIADMFGMERTATYKDPVTGKQVPITGDLFDFSGIQLPGMSGKVGYGGLPLGKLGDYGPAGPQPTATVSGWQDLKRTSSGALAVHVTNMGSQVGSGLPNVGGTLSADMTRGLKVGDSYGSISTATPGFGGAITPAPYEVDDRINEWGEEHSEIAEEGVAVTEEVAGNTALTAKATVASGQGVMGSVMQSGREVISGVGGAISSGLQWLGSMIGSMGGGRGGGGGGTNLFGWTSGNPFVDMAASMGVSYVSSKLTSKIKNPYLATAANLGINYAAQKYVLPQIFGSAGAAGGIGGMAGMGGLAAMGGSALTSLGMFTGSQTISALGAGLQYGINPFGQQAQMLAAQNAGFASSTMSSVMPYAGSIMMALQGNVKGAVAGGVATYALMATPLAPVAPILGPLLGGLFGKGGGGHTPNPRVHSYLRIRGNNDINALAIVYDNNDSTNENMRDTAKRLARAAWNAAKIIEARTKIPSPIDGVYMRVERDMVCCDLPLPGESPSASVYAKHHKNYGKPDKSVAYYTNLIVKQVGELYKQLVSGKSAEIQQAIDTGLKYKSTTTLTSGAAPELKAGKYKIDQSVSTADSDAKAMDLATALAKNPPKITGLETSSDGENGTQAALLRDPTRTDSEGNANYLIVGPNGEYLTTDQAGNVGAKRMVFSLKEGKYVEAPYAEKKFDSKEIVGNFLGVKDGQKIIRDYDESVLGFDQAGNPIYNIGAGGQREDYKRASSNSPFKLDLNKPTGQDFLADARQHMIDYGQITPQTGSTSVSQETNNVVANDSSTKIAGGVGNQVTNYFNASASSSTLFSNESSV